MEMIRTWFNSMDERGWMPREQARGIEVEDSFKQKDYVYQDMEEANPPTLMFVMNYLKTISTAHEDKYNQDKIFHFLQELRPYLIRWYKFFNSTQLNTEVKYVGEMPGRIFRWRCKFPCNANFYMGSGLDDYPRHEMMQVSIGHLDLQCWMLFMVNSLLELDDFLDQYSPDLIEEQELIKLGLEEFYDPKVNIYNDIIANALDQKTGAMKLYGTHLGYINLFPIIFGFVNARVNQKCFGTLLGFVSAEEHLLSKFGIRSLSAKDQFYQQGAHYWTEPIWMQMNYLIVRGFHEYYMRESDMGRFYGSVRNSVINTLYQNYKLSHTVFEHYNSNTGRGGCFQDFTGWTATAALLISAEEY